ncbi:ComF family protein [Cognataquiflexum rubidum]|uniref:ComF family protein n=1 Tax=Cognataquiflexum rubidum TaxID=2922273 RepID=UPI001F12B9E4|nr:ComF family protein [Cognataquiflexum rubidum]MCH6233866.1 ComF family protein [Cognataquiflexum rubidum]
MYSRIFEDFLALVFPKTCCLCKRSLFDFEDQMCKVCIAALPITNYHLRPQNNELVTKIMGLTQPNLVMSFLRFSKKGASQSLLHQLKYKNKPEIGVEIGRLYGNILHESGFKNNWDQITPVPLHPVKQKKRGYNQSEQFAKGLSESLGIPVVLSLIRVQYTETQTKKSRMERIENVAEVFDIDPNKEVNGKRLLLVDDVMTTGATLITCANVLLEKGSEVVDLAVIAAGKNQ